MDEEFSIVKLIEELGNVLLRATHIKRLHLGSRWRISRSRILTFAYLSRFYMSNLRKNVGFHIYIDCGFIIQNMSGEKRYVWAQRTLAINEVTKVHNTRDFDLLLKGKIWTVWITNHWVTNNSLLCSNTSRTGATRRSRWIDASSKYKSCGSKLVREIWFHSQNTADLLCISVKNDSWKIKVY